MNKTKRKPNKNMSTKTAMISQPMAGKTDEEIRLTKLGAEMHLAELGYEVVDTYFADEWLNEDKTKNKPVAFLAKSIEAMSRCDAVYFCAGWEKARGCRIEHEIAREYGLGIFDAKRRQYTLSASEELMEGLEEEML